METQTTTDKKEGQSICAYCGKAGSKKCGKCKQQFYCSSECQQEDWKNHKLNCKPITDTSPAPSNPTNQSEQKQPDQASSNNKPQDPSLPPSETTPNPPPKPPLRPMVVRLRSFEQMFTDDIQVQLNNYITIADATEFLKKQYSSELRLWLFLTGKEIVQFSTKFTPRGFQSAFGLLDKPQLSMGDIGVENGQLFLYEKRGSDGSWPTERATALGDEETPELFFLNRNQFHQNAFQHPHQHSNVRRQDVDMPPMASSASHHENSDSDEEDDMQRLLAHFKNGALRGYDPRMLEARMRGMDMGPGMGPGMPMFPGFGPPVVRKSLAEVEEENLQTAIKISLEEAKVRDEKDKKITAEQEQIQQFYQGLQTTETATQPAPPTPVLKKSVVADLDDELGFEEDLDFEEEFEDEEGEEAEEGDAEEES